MAADQESLDASESALQRAVRAGDVDTLDRLLDDEVRYVGPDGVVTSKAADLAIHRSRTLALVELRQLRRESQLLGAIGITRVWLQLRGSYGDGPLDAQMVYTRTWRWAEGRWRVVAAQGAPYSGTVPPSS